MIVIIYGHTHLQVKHVYSLVVISDYVTILYNFHRFRWCAVSRSQVPQLFLVSNLPMSTCSFPNLFGQPSQLQRPSLMVFSGNQQTLINDLSWNGLVCSTLFHLSYHIWFAKYLWFQTRSRGCCKTYSYWLNLFIRIYRFLFAKVTLYLWKFPSLSIKSCEPTWAIIKSRLPKINQQSDPPNWLYDTDLSTIWEGLAVCFAGK